MHITLSFPRILQRVLFYKWSLVPPINYDYSETNFSLLCMRKSMLEALCLLITLIIKFCINFILKKSNICYQKCMNKHVSVMISFWRCLILQSNHNRIVVFWTWQMNYLRLHRLTFELDLRAESVYICIPFLNTVQHLHALPTYISELTTPFRYTRRLNP